MSVAYKISIEKDWIYDPIVAAGGKSLLASITVYLSVIKSPRPTQPSHPSVGR